MSEVAQSCLTLCDRMDCSLPGSSVHGIFQATVLEWIAISFSRGSSQPRDWTRVSGIVDRRFTIWATREVPKVKKVKVTQSCPTLCNPMDYRVHGILQARILEWVVISFPRGSSWPRDWTQVSRIAGRLFTNRVTRKGHRGFNLLPLNCHSGNFILIHRLV